MGALDMLIRLAQRRFMRPVVRLADAAVSEFEAQRYQLLPPVYTRTAQTPRDPSRHLALVTGYFSNDLGRATFGDTEAMRVVTSWLEELGIPYDVAGTEGNGISGVDLERVDPAPYTIFIFVCGPWLEPHNRMLKRFSHAFKIGVNLSIEAGVSHGFDLLVARDLPDQQSPDLVFGARLERRPLAGIILAHLQFEYGKRQAHRRVADVVASYLRRDEVVGIPLDTTHLYNVAGITTAEQLDNIVRRLDVVITTRLHGMVFALKNGVPVVAIDAIAGGAKVTKQAQALGWPLVFDGGIVTEKEIAGAVARCLRGELKGVMGQLQGSARSGVDRMHARFVETVRALPVGTRP